MLTTARRICGKIMHPQTALHSQWDKGWKNNSQFASLSIRRPTGLSAISLIWEISFVTTVLSTFNSTVLLFFLTLFPSSNFSLSNRTSFWSWVSLSIPFSQSE